MTNIILINKLKERIETLVKDFSLQTNVEGHEYKAPQVVTGYLKESEKSPVMDEQEITPDLPAVIVRFMSEDEDRNGNVAQVRLIIVTYSEDEQNGWIESLNVANRIKIGLKQNPIIDERFQIDEDTFRIEHPDAQPFPEWVTFVTFNVYVPQAQYEFEWGEFYK